MSTLSRITYDATVKARYERLKARKGVGMIAVVAETMKVKNI
jgi:hypothetical protein